MDIGYIIFFSIAYSVIGTIIGYVCFLILDEKGYNKKIPPKNYGFVLGFFLTIIGIIICICKPNLITKSNKETSSLNTDNKITTLNEDKKIEQIIKYKKLLDTGAITEQEYNKAKERILK